MSKGKIAVLGAGNGDDRSCKAGWVLASDGKRDCETGRVRIGVWACGSYVWRAALDGDGVVAMVAIPKDLTP